MLSSRGRLLLRGAVFVLCWGCALGGWLTGTDWFALAHGGLRVYDGIGLLMVADGLYGLLSPGRWRLPGDLAQTRRPLSPARKGENRRIVLVTLAVWAALWSAGAALVFLEVIPRALVLPAVASLMLLDRFFVTVWCPFSRWLTHSRCCNACRLKDWGEAMVYSPLLVFTRWWAVAPAALGLLILLRWELRLRRYPSLMDPALRPDLRCDRCPRPCRKPPQGKQA